MNQLIVKTSCKLYSVREKTYRLQLRIAVSVSPLATLLCLQQTLSNQFLTETISLMGLEGVPSIL